jgi:hypothetical protein
VIRTAVEPQRTIIGTFMVLAAIVAAVAPMPVSLRSAAVALFAYLAFSVGGMAFAYVAALVAPALGLLGGDTAWLIMLPIVLSGNLLAMLGLEYAWRWAALLVSPLLLVAPALFVQTMSRRELFRVELPWDDAVACGSACTCWSACSACWSRSWSTVDAPPTSPVPPRRAAAGAPATPASPTA